MTPEDLYYKWLTLFDIPFDMYPDIIKFDNYKVYTPFTYKFTFNLGLSISGELYQYKFRETDYKLFADLFFTEGYEDELKHQLKLGNITVWNKHPNYSTNYGEISYYVKPWVDYVTFQGYRTIVQFRWDKFLRLEKLKKINRL